MRQENIKEYKFKSDTINNIDDESAFSQIMSSCNVNYGNVLRIKRKKLIIVFVPGIMASRLFSSSGKRVWDPDSDMVMIKFFGLTPQDRQKLLLPDRPLSTPEKSSTIPIDDTLKKYTYALERGWHTISWKYYGSLIENLDKWTTQIKAFIDMKIYAFGYNWLQSNEISGNELNVMLSDLVAQEKKVLKTLKCFLFLTQWGGLVVRSCINEFEDKNLILGVIHGAQPAMGAPAAYRRQKAGFESHSCGEWLVRLVLGKDGPNVRAIFPYARGPLELLPCTYYDDNKVPNKGWFSYDMFINGSLNTVYVEPSKIYDEVYKKFDDECYFGMLNKGEILTFIVQKQNLSIEIIKKYISLAEYFHDTLNNSTIHPRTIQLFSRGKPTCCSIHWKIEDVTDKIKTCDFKEQTSDSNIAHCDENIRRIIPYPIDGKNDYYELRWVNSDWTIGEIILTSRKGSKLKYGEEIKDSLEHEYQNRRIVLCTLTKPTADGKPDLKNKHWGLDGDGTVPIASVIELQTSIKGWPEDLQPLLPSYTYGEKNAEATSLSSKREHSEFFNDPDVIEKTKKIIYNLCVAWLKGDIE